MRLNRVARFVLYGAVVILAGLWVWVTWWAWRSDNLGFATRTYWDWMELLIIPVALALASFWFSRVQQRIEKETALERQRQNTLDQYLDKMTELILERGLGPQAEPEVQRLARARTLVAMRDLDARRNRQVVQFLRESELLGSGSVVDLSHAELGGADLAGAALSGVKMTRVNLRQADLREASLSGADLAHADLRGANLRDAFLTGANLTGAELTGADLTGADLGGANLTGTSLKQAKVSASQLSRIGHATGVERAPK